MGVAAPTRDQLPRAVEGMPYGWYAENRLSRAQAHAIVAGYVSAGKAERSRRSRRLRA